MVQSCYVVNRLRPAGGVVGLRWFNGWSCYVVNTLCAVVLWNCFSLGSSVELVAWADFYFQLQWANWWRLLDGTWMKRNSIGNSKSYDIKQSRWPNQQPVCDSATMGVWDTAYRPGKCLSFSFSIGFYIMS